MPDFRIPCAAIIACFGAQMAVADPIGFYTEGTTNSANRSYGIVQSAGAGAPATIDLEQRIPNPLSEFLPRFDPSIGTLNRVDLYFGIVSAPSQDNRIDVSLDACAGCEKDLDVDVSFGFGADLLGRNSEQSGAIRQFFEISEQSFIEFQDFDNDASTPFRPPSGSVALTPGSLDGQFSTRSFTQDLNFFIGGGNVFFDVGSAVSLFGSLSCRDAALNQVGCSETLDLTIGNVDWAMQIVYDYTPDFGLVVGQPPAEPRDVYAAVEGLQILRTDSGIEDLRFFDPRNGFAPAVIPVPVPALLLLTGIAALVGLNRRRV